MLKVPYAYNCMTNYPVFGLLSNAPARCLPQPWFPGHERFLLYPMLRHEVNADILPRSARKAQRTAKTDDYWLLNSDLVVSQPFTTGGAQSGERLELASVALTTALAIR